MRTCLLTYLLTYLHLLPQVMGGMMLLALHLTLTLTLNPTPTPNPNQVMGGMMLLALHGPGGISLDQGAKKSI